MIVQNKNQKLIHYNFPIKLDSNSIREIPKTFYLFNCRIPLELNNLKNKQQNSQNQEYESILDSGSYCNFISTNLIKKLNLQPQNTTNTIYIKGISGTTKLNTYVYLYFSCEIYIDSNIYLVTFKEKFLITDKIPTYLLLGNQFMNKFQLHYSYKNNIIFTDLNFKNFRKKFLLLKNYKKFNKNFIYKKLDNSNLNKYKNFNSKNFSNFNKYKNFNIKNYVNSNKYKNVKSKNYSNFYNKKFLNKNFDSKENYNNVKSLKPNYIVNSNRKHIQINDKINSKIHTSYINYNKNYQKIKNNNTNSYLKFIKNRSKNFRKIYKKLTHKESKNLHYKKFKNSTCVTSNPRTINHYKNLKNFSKISKNKLKFRDEFNFNYFIYSFLSNKNDEYNYLDDEEEEEDFELTDIPEPYRDLKEVFSKVKADKLPPHRLTDCKIVLQKDATLHYGPIYPLSEQENEALKDYIEENLKKGFIRESESPAGYPVLFQKKKDGSLRLCVDYKKLNAVTVRNSYPLPLITDIIEHVKGANYFTKLDLRSAYNLIRIREGDEYKTAFRTKYGHYEYLVMPFGLTNAPATFQSFINSVLRQYLEKFVILYLDDILIYSKTLEEHIQHVRTVLKTLLDNNLYAKPKKCEFHKPKVEFLGHVISGNGIATDPNKIKSVEEWPTPKSVKDVQRFLGLCNYYRRFVENFAFIARPLHNLTKKNVKFIWSKDCEKAFQELKKRLITSPILMHPDTQKPFIVECDASNFAIGAILSQKDDEGKLHPVAYYSRSLNNAELNYSITEKELLAIKCAFSTWRHLLLGAKYQVTVFTDHRNLLYTLGGKVGNQRQHRWHLFFQEYNFQLIYRQGRKNGKPDSLSRRPDYEKDIKETLPENILDSKNVQSEFNFMGIVSTFIDKIIQENKNDETAKDIQWYFSPINAEHGYNFRPFRKMNKFEIKNGMILYNKLIYVPASLRLEILNNYHDRPTAGHLGIRRTEELIARNFWWPKMHEEITKFVNSCDQCARNKVNRHKRYDLLRPLEIPDRPWKSIEIDFLCGLPESKKYTVIMVVVDRFSKMIHLIPFKEIPNAEETAKAFIKHIFRLHGLPEEIFTDRGSQFTSALWLELMDKLWIRPKIATTDHHETVGQVERCNSFIEQYLRCYSRAFFHDDWVEWLHLAEFVYNNTIHESTKQSPFFINYGFNPPIDDVFLLNGTNSNFKYIQNVGDNFPLVKEVLFRSQELYKRQADKRRMKAPELKENQKVWIHAPPVFATTENPKLAPRKYGPYKVLEVLNNGNYKIDISKSPFPKHHPVFHISELEPYIPTPVEYKNRKRYKENTAEIVEIADFRTNYKEKRYEYKIRYKHRLAWHWVPAEVIENDPRYQDLLIQFNKSIRKK